MLNPIYFWKNYVRLSHKLALNIEERERWTNLLPFPQAQIVTFATGSLELWDQLVNYTSVPRAKAIFCTQATSPPATVNGNEPIRDEAVKGDDVLDEDDFFEVVDDYEGLENLPPFTTNTIPEEQVWSLDDCLVSASAKIRELVTERLLTSPNDLGAMVAEPTVNNIGLGENHLESSLSHKARVEYKRAISRFDVSDDYDSSPSVLGNSIGNAPQVKLEKLDLITELSKLDFGKLPKTLPLSIDISDMYYDASIDNHSVEELDRIQKIEELIEAKQRRLNILLEKEAEFQTRQKLNQVASLKCDARASEPTPSSPIFKGEGDSFKSTGVSSKCGFYENLERIVQDLVDFKEHSYPFLTPVVRKTAPDYYKKIANPMDLMTVLKKIKAHKYTTKQDFSSDLFLIYSNCRAYNTTKGNEFIYHAKAMEERTKQLLQALPDNFSKLTPEIPDRSASLTPGKPTPKPTPKAASLDAHPSPTFSHKDFGLDFGTAPQSNLPEVTEVSHQETIVRLEREIASLRDTHKTLSAGGIAGPDPRTGAYCDLTRDLRAHNELLRFAVATDDFESIPSLVSGVNATLALPSTRKRLPLGDLLSAAKRPRHTEVISMFPELAPVGAVPDLHQPSQPSTPVTQPPLSDFAALKIPTSTATRHMLQNIAELRRNRDLVDRIAITKEFLENPEDRQALHYLNTPVETVVSNTLLGASGLTGKPELNSASAHAVMRRMAALLLQHAGFDSAEGGALEVFTDLFERHLQALGQTMQLYITNHSNMTPEEILLHTLFENKVQGPTDLENYVADGITRHGVRLREIGAKLRAKFEGLATRPCEEDSEFEDSALVGNFEEFTGDDFFGFKELGLDKELGLTSLSVPVRLLIGNKRKRADAPVNGAAEVLPLDYTPPEPFSPLDDPNKPIGLLRPFFNERMQDGTIKLFRPRVPPVGKQAILARRRQADQMAQASEKKHKRAKEVEARKHQKLIKQKEKEQRQIERKAKQQARMQAREAEKEKKRVAREEQALRRKQGTEQRTAPRSATASATPFEEDLPATSPISSTTTVVSSSPSSTTTPSDDESLTQSLGKSLGVRRTAQPLRREVRRPIRPLGLKCPPHVNEGSFSGSASLSEDDLDHPTYRQVKPPRWVSAVPPMNQKPSVSN
ncbi:Transcriptional activator spt7, partial [Massospora cicadina]